MLTAAAQPAVGLVKSNVFEGLFVHMVRVRPGTPFAGALREVGYDVAHPQSAYPTPVLQACLHVAARQLLPGKPLAEAQWELGRRFVDGFFKTLAGRTLGLLMPVFGAEGTVKQLPRFFSMGNTGSLITVKPEAEHVWHFELRDRVPLCDFDAGIIEQGLRRAGVEPQVTVVERGPEHFVLRLSW